MRRGVFGPFTPAEYNMSIEALRREVREGWEKEWALTTALRDLPAVPPYEILVLLHEGAKWPDDNCRGKDLQRLLGFAAIPLKSEAEAGAGLWSLIRAGIARGRQEDRQAEEQEKTGMPTKKNDIEEIVVGDISAKIWDSLFILGCLKNLSPREAQTLRSMHRKMLMDFARTLAPEMGPGDST